MSRWDPSSKLVTDVDSVFTRGGKTPPSSRQSRRDDASVSLSRKSAPVRLDYRWDMRKHQVIAFDPDVTRWDPKTNTIITHKRSDRGRGENGSLSSDASTIASVQTMPILRTESKLDSESGSSPKSVAFRDDVSLESIAEGSISRPHSADSIGGALTSIPERYASFSRPQSADAAGRRKKLKELQVRNMLSRLSSSRLSVSDGAEQESESGEDAATVETERVRRMREELDRKDKLLDEQQRMIQELTDQVETLSRKDSGDIPNEIKDREDSPVSQMGSVLSAFPFRAFPFFSTQEETTKKATVVVK